MVVYENVKDFDKMICNYFQNLSKYVNSGFILRFKKS